MIATKWEYIENDDYFYRRRLISNDLCNTSQSCEICGKENNHVHIQEEKHNQLRKCYNCGKEKIQDYNDNSSKCLGCGYCVAGTAEKFLIMKDK